MIDHKSFGGIFTNKTNIMRDKMTEEIREMNEFPLTEDTEILTEVEIESIVIQPDGSIKIGINKKGIPLEVFFTILDERYKKKEDNNEEI